MVSQQLRLLRLQEVLQSQINLLSISSLEVTALDIDIKTAAHGLIGLPLHTHQTV
jgi:hypothetical protein